MSAARVRKKMKARSTPEISARRLRSSRFQAWLHRPRCLVWITSSAKSKGWTTVELCAVTKGPLVPNSRIGDRVQQIHDQVHEGDDDGEEQGYAHDEVVVA